MQNTGHIFWIGVLLGCLVAIIYFAFISDVGLPDHPLIRGKNDLVFHALAFAAMGLPSLALFGLLRGSVLVVAAIVLVEVAQIFMPDRNASIEDILSGLFGFVVIAGPKWLLERTR